MKILAGDIKKGDILNIESDLYRVISLEHVKPGKGGAFHQVELQKLYSKKQKRNIRLRSEENVDKFEIFSEDGVFLYKQKELYVFLNVSTSETLEVTEDKIENAIYLKEDMKVELLMDVNGDLVHVKLPLVVVLAVRSAGAYIKGQSAASQDKTVVLENGEELKVPQYIVDGDLVEINLESKSFISRVR